MDTSFNEDPLMLLRVLAVDIPNHRSFRATIILVFLLHFGVTCVYFFELAITFNGQLLVKYGMTSSFSILGCLAMAVRLSIHRKISVEATERYRNLTSDTINKETKRRIQKECRLTTIWTVANTILLSIAIYYFWPISNKESNKLFFVMTLFRKYFSKYYGILALIFYASFLAGAFSTSANIYALIYFLSYERFKVYKINDLIARLAMPHREEVNEYQLLKNRSYHNRVFLTLRICVKHHTILKSHQSKNRHVANLCVLILGCFSIVPFVAFLFNVAAEGLDDGYQRWLSSGLAMFMTSFLSFFFNEFLIDESKAMYNNLTEVPWTTWDLKNRKVLLTMLLNMQKPPTLGIPGLMVCEYSFFIRALQFMASTCMFFIQVVGIIK